MGDAVYNFQYCLSVAGVAYVPVDGGSGTGLVQTDNPDGRKGCFNFVDKKIVQAQLTSCRLLTVRLFSVRS